jgi:DMSO reductase anchor subunit
MHPAFSVIGFTTLLGAAQGLLVSLAALQLLGVAVPGLPILLGIATGLLVVSLGASFFHLGHPERAWRAAAMWRTSWLSREVIVLPVFIFLTGTWTLLELMEQEAGWILMPLILVSLLLWLCTAMIYACLKFIQEWAHPLTLMNYLALGLASGIVLLISLLALMAEDSKLTSQLHPWAIGITLIALMLRQMSSIRNKSLKPKSSLQTATGIREPQLRQKSMGMSAGAFNTREFFHGQTALFLRHVKAMMWGLCFALPLILLLLSMATGHSAFAILAFPIQYLGLLAERWLFFAQARHPQNLYYQTVS